MPKYAMIYFIHLSDVSIFISGQSSFQFWNMYLMFSSYINHETNTFKYVKSLHGHAVHNYFFPNTQFMFNLCLYFVVL